MGSKNRKPEDHILRDELDDVIFLLGHPEVDWGAVDEELDRAHQIVKDHLMHYGVLSQSLEILGAQAGTEDIEIEEADDVMIVAKGFAHYTERVVHGALLPMNEWFDDIEEAFEDLFEMSRKIVARRTT